ncbi:Glycosyltransferase involved in cell wall bisynthesis [Fodinibius roseus]|uniref:Glycosyltransferase involved in cell wall bisynthesis n=1 Tax=Fodinibius roseus TaxID=1194090 RepID=A0A1M4SP61_9BACT|nr:glycosyltransferase family 2 protein [Fodinibius roseus]SHE33991.1 Glycosyltransferase involved in cell wall bisynthesis [Fodinibius roseus]
MTTQTSLKQGKSIKKEEEPFVSVLTPAYNGEEFLRECIESVLKQDYDNWEYVLVNNKSTDSTLEIIKEYAALDSRIRIHNNEEFLPQMENLNHAFRQISPESKYCKVVHADDWLFPECLSRMVEVAEEYPSVGIVSAYRLDGNKVELDGLPYPSNFNSGREIARKYLLYGFSKFGSPSSLLIRSELIRKREKMYDESFLSSDTGACLDLLKESDFGFVHQVLTYTRLHENSVTNTLAEESFASIHGELAFQLKYGPYFLTEEEYKRRLSQKVNLFYILLARNFVDEKSISKFREQIKILEELEIPFKTGWFFKNLVRELFLQFFKLFGFELKKADK